MYKLNSLTYGCCVSRIGTILSWPLDGSTIAMLPIRDGRNYPGCSKLLRFTVNFSLRYYFRIYLTLAVSGIMPSSAARRQKVLILPHGSNFGSPRGKEGGPMGQIAAGLGYRET